MSFTFKKLCSPLYVTGRSQIECFRTILAKCETDRSVKLPISLSSRRRLKWRPAPHCAEALSVLRANLRIPQSRIILTAWDIKLNYYQKYNCCYCDSRSDEFDVHGSVHLDNIYVQLQVKLDVHCYVLFILLYY
jgi:hypothetical protein